MCGVLVQFNLNRGIQFEEFSKNVARLSHRGPDETGIFLSDDGRLAMGHRRLAVVDLSAAASQPMQSLRGKSIVVFNGEIYNFKTVRHDLRRLGVLFASESDTEVVLRAFEAWGCNCLSKLEGMFAFCIFDECRQQLVFARDRVGEKPLFYYHDSKVFALASELKALIDLVGEERRLDLGALDEYFTWGYVHGSRCLLTGFRKLAPATFGVLDLDKNELRIDSYWSVPSVEPTVSSSTNPLELADQLDGLLTSAVRSQLVADVPVGVLLSGGLDSSLVAAYAAHSNRNIRTFTVSFPTSPEHDESAHASQVARHLGTDHTEIPLPEIDIDLLDLIAVQVDEPIADPSLLPTAALTRAVREHVTVALGGDGGDELFGGYPQYAELARAERWRRRVPSTLRRIIASSLGQLPQMPPSVNGVRSLFDPPGSIGRYNVFFNAGTRATLLRAFGCSFTEDPELSRDQLTEPGLPAGERAARADFLSYLPDEVLVKVDRASMLYSLETRAPFLDKQVVEFAFSKVPWSCKIKGGHRKILLRELARRHLPADFDSTRKQGFSPPLVQWLNAGMYYRIDEMVAHLSSKGFDRHTLTRLAANPRRHANRIFLLIMLSKWMSNYRILC